MFQAGQRGGLDGQRAGDVVIRRRNGQHDVLAFERVIGKSVIPCGFQVSEIAGVDFGGRQARDLNRAVPRENRRGAVNSGVTQPRFRRRNQTVGLLRALLFGENADNRGLRAGFPRQAEGGFAEFSGVRLIMKRRERLALFDFSGGDKLRNPKQADRAVSLRRIHIRRRRIRCSQINSN